MVEKTTYLERNKKGKRWKTNEILKQCATKDTNFETKSSKVWSRDGVDIIVRLILVSQLKRLQYLSLGI